MIKQKQIKIIRQIKEKKEKEDSANLKISL